MTRKTVFMFSGQGSHYFQMGRELFERDVVFRQSMTAMDVLLKDSYGFSVIDLLYLQEHPKHLPFDRLEWTHPAIFMVEISLAKALESRGITPDLVLGASLGTLAASVTAGCLPWTAGLHTVMAQSRIAMATCQPGAMTAVIGAQDLYHTLGLERHGELASLNYASHFVVAATVPGAEIIETTLKARAVPFQRLQVGYAFHSRWIEAARERCLAHLATLRTNEARIPIACCAKADLIRKLDGTHFWDVTRQPIQFSKTLAYLELSGDGHDYIDVGPAGTLANFAKQALSATSAARIHSVMTPFGNDMKNIERLLTAMNSSRLI